jgi:hypothetical protein
MDQTLAFHRNNGFARIRNRLGNQIALRYASGADLTNGETSRGYCTDHTKACSSDAIVQPNLWDVKGKMML